MIGLRCRFIIIFSYSLAFFLFLMASFVSFDICEAALCALRNPDRDLKVLFPEATGYKSVPKDIDREAEAKIEEELGHQLDFSDIGIHTIYIALKGTKPIGLLHPHAERGTYGTIEIIWAFTIEGKIKDFLIQRSREKNTKDLISDEFRGQFIGKTEGFPFTIGDNKEINTEFLNPAKGPLKGSSVVAYAAKKVLLYNKYIFHREIREAYEQQNILGQQEITP